MLLKFDNEADWLAEKEKDVTSTEIAALFGLNPYKSRLRLWHEKAGTVKSDFVESPFSIWGRRLQTAVGLGICEDENWKGFDLTGYYLRDPAIKSGASLDMKAICAERGKVNLEIKVAEEFREEDGWGENAAPIHYEFQMQMQMHEAKKHGDPFDISCLGTLGRRQSTRLIFREYDAGVGEMMDEAVHDFWQSIDKNEPPPPDYAVDGGILEKLAKPVRMGESRNMSLDNRAVYLVERCKELDALAKPIKAQLKEFNAEKEAIKNEIHAKMQNAETAIIGDFIVTAKERVVEEFWNAGHRTRGFSIKKKR